VILTWFCSCVLSYCTRVMLCKLYHFIPRFSGVGIILYPCPSVPEYVSVEGVRNRWWVYEFEKGRAIPTAFLALPTINCGEFIATYNVRWPCYRWRPLLSCWYPCNHESKGVDAREERNHSSIKYIYSHPKNHNKIGSKYKISSECSLSQNNKKHYCNIFN
jgi:hypothetical protein